MALFDYVRATSDHFRSREEGSKLNESLIRSLAARLGPIRRAEVLDVDSYTTTRTRAVLWCTEGGSRRIFVKTPSRSLKIRLVVEGAGLTAAEIRFYRELSSGVPVRTPECIYSRHDGANFELVLEDLKERYQISGGETACSLSEAEAVVDALADLHAFGWKANLPAWMERQLDRERKLGARLGVRLMRSGLRAAGDLITPKLWREAIVYELLRRDADRVLTSGPLTLIHNDCHRGNLAFDQNGEPIFFDWQMTRVGQWARDVSYFCTFSLDRSERSRSERNLLERYLERLAAAGGPVLPRKDAWTAYRRHTAYAFEAAAVTLGLTASEDTAARIWLQRSAAAVEELDSFSALGLESCRIE